jgi:hypothetical protein
MKHAKFNPNLPDPTFHDRLIGLNNVSRMEDQQCKGQHCELLQSVYLKSFDSLPVLNNRIAEICHSLSKSNPNCCEKFLWPWSGYSDSCTLWKVLIIKWMNCFDDGCILYMDILNLHTFWRKKLNHAVHAWPIIHGVAEIESGMNSSVVEIGSSMHQTTI